MTFNTRKLLVWLLSLGGVLAVFLLYNRISETPTIDIGKQKKFAGDVPDVNVTTSDTRIGKVGDVGISTVKKARYTHLNEKKQIDREFGFEKLLHELGDEWDIEKPYMNIFRRSFNCFITADRGKVRVETAVGQPSPKDVTLTGNVVIHILPKEESDIQESFIYLDDITFISDRSQYSTDGPVKFVSDNAQMLGTGAVIVYNEELDQIQLLRIIDLKSLNLRIPEAGLFSPKKTDVDTAAGTGSQPETQRPAKTAPADLMPKPSPTPGPVVARQEKGQRYKCLFRKNVVIDAPEQLIFADEFCVNNIFQPESSTEKSEKTDTAASQPQSKKSTQAITEETAGTKQTYAAKPSEPNESSEQFVDVVVTCSNGIIVTPMGTPEAPEDSSKLTTAADVSNDKASKTVDDANGRAVFVAERIDHDASAGDTIASGPSELTFYATDIMDSPNKEIAAPVKVTADKKAQFFPALNQVIFEGDCLCEMLRDDPNMQRKYTLSAPKLTVTLAKKETRQTSTSDIDIEHLTAAGGGVKLATIKTAGEELIGGIELKCKVFNYDTPRQFFSATGPGLIKFKNSKIPQPKEDVGKFSLKKPCYVIVRDFDILNYYEQKNLIIADAKQQEVLIDYFPITNGQYGQQTSASARHIEAYLKKTAEGENELSTLTATGGISYKEKGMQFEGSKLFHDAETSFMTVDGDELQPCNFNGVLADSFKYDLKTGKVTAKITGPGTLQR